MLPISQDYKAGQMDKTDILYFSVHTYTYIPIAKPFVFFLQSTSGTNIVGQIDVIVHHIARGNRQIILLWGNKHGINLQCLLFTSVR